MSSGRWPRAAVRAFARGVFQPFEPRAEWTSLGVNVMELTFTNIGSEMKLA